VDGAFRSEMSLNMTDKETNALKQIFEIINEVMETAMGGSGSKT
jgi:L-serine deaminase